jgi:putative phosphoribosyl transferase
MIFRDRIEAGKLLAQKLRKYAGRLDTVVLALPRGGVPVGAQIAEALGLPLDVFVVRKLGVPGHEELAMGAIASGGVRVLNEDIVQALHIPQQIIERVAAEEQRELERRERLYRQGKRPIDIRNKFVILVDDGLATGATMRAAAEALKRQGVKGVIVAVPVAAKSTCDEFKYEVDEIVCAATPEPFYGVGSWYRDFSQTSDEEVIELLERFGRPSLQHDESRSS